MAITVQDRGFGTEKGIKIKRRHGATQFRLEIHKWDRKTKLCPVKRNKGESTQL